MSTAAGALDFIVVEDTGVAQRCVELLRRSGLGVATFLLLDKQAHLAGKLAERVSPPEGACGGGGGRVGVRGMCLWEGWQMRVGKNAWMYVCTCSLSECRELI